MTNSHVANHEQCKSRETCQSMTRRGFWRESLRAAALVVLSATTVRLGLRQVGLQTHVDCRRSVCNGCSRVAACSLPQAQIFRSSLEDPQAHTDCYPERYLKRKKIFEEESGRENERGAGQRTIWKVISVASRQIVGRREMP